MAPWESSGTMPFDLHLQQDLPIGSQIDCESIVT